jgi:hypothetical protein
MGAASQDFGLGVLIRVGVRHRVRALAGGDLFEMRFLISAIPLLCASVGVDREGDECCDSDCH